MNKQKNAQIKVKHNCIPPEDIHPEKIYSFSYNPQEQPLFEKFYKMKLNNLSDWSNQMKNIFQNLKFCNIEVNLELSRKGRFHYHGVIKIDKPIEFVLHDLKMLAHYGTYEIDHINNFEQWNTYCEKQQHLIEPYCEHHNMSYCISTFD